MLIKATLIDAQLTPLRTTRLANDQIAGLLHPLKIDFGGQLRLLGYDISPASVPAGESIRVDLYWRALTPIDQAYQATVGIVDARGEIWSPKSLERPRGFQDYPPTPQWPTSSYAIDSFELPINPGTPPDNYSIFVEVFNRTTLISLPAPAELPHPVQRPAAAIIESLTVIPASNIFSIEQLGLYNLKIEQALNADIQLLGVNRDRDDASPGETVLLTLFWQALKKPAADYAAKIELLDSHNQSIVARDFPLGDGRYLTSNWNAAEQIVDLDRVRIPVGAGSGTYHWRVTLANQVPVDLGELRVTAPARSFSKPPIAQPIDQTFDKKITLLGYYTEGSIAAGQPITVTLYWRAEADMDTSYKVFVHVLDANNQPRAQADAIPLNGSRPTTGWQPGEILTDTYTLNLPADLPAGQYRLVTGLYDPNDLTRLQLPNGDDQVELK